MKIHIFENYTGMVEGRFHPNYKTVVILVGKVREGILTIGSQSFEISGGQAIVPLSAFGNAKELKINVSAKVDGKARNVDCGKIRLEATGAYKPDDIDGRAALIEARHLIDELRREMYTIERRLKAHTDKAKQKFMGGHDL